MTTTKTQNIARGNAMGCASLVEDAVGAGADHGDIAVSLDMLEEQGYEWLENEPATAGV